MISKDKTTCNTIFPFTCWNKITPITKLHKKITATTKNETQQMHMTEHLAKLISSLK